MLRKQFLLTSSLVLLACEALATPTETQEDAAHSLITPSAQLHERQTSGSATCGYIDGDFKTPMVCSSGYTCSTYFAAASAGFACCNSQGCPSDFQQCIPSTTNSIASCRFASSKCLYWLTTSSTGSNSQCLYYTLYETVDYEVINGRAFSMSCTDGPSATTVEVWSTATNAPLQTVTCIPSGFSYATPSTTKCASPAVLLIPLIVSNIMFLAANILLSSFRYQRKLKFWSKPKGVDDPWSPWSGLSTVLLAVIQAIATAALIRAGGYKADWINLILLWLMRPRMLWAVMLFYSIFGKQYKRSGTDSLFADGILNILSIPIAAWFIEAYASDTQ
ncbi:hypothetical protein EG329_009730 [Mollisiaceae sp. DMI_Dod_QoI]|nr:hypothetical protein EG329_009730 [Helotiales sp. DMI_Dod_QoI]